MTVNEWFIAWFPTARPFTRPQRPNGSRVVERSTAPTTEKKVLHLLRDSLRNNGYRLLTKREINLAEYSCRILARLCFVFMPINTQKQGQYFFCQLLQLSKVGDKTQFSIQLQNRIHGTFISRPVYCAIILIFCHYLPTVKDDSVLVYRRNE